MNLNLLQSFFPHRIIIELVLTFLALTSVLYMYLGFPGGEDFAFLLPTTLAIYYFLSAYFVYELSMFIGIIATKVVGIASAISVMGILFTLMSFEGAPNMLFIGCTSIGSGSLVVAYVWFRTGESTLLPLVVRGVVLFAITTILLQWTPRLH